MGVEDDEVDAMDRESEGFASVTLVPSPARFHALKTAMTCFAFVGSGTASAVLQVGASEWNERTQGA